MHAIHRGIIVVFFNDGLALALFKRSMRIPSHSKIVEGLKIALVKADRGIIVGD